MYYPDYDYNNNYIDIIEHYIEERQTPNLIDFESHDSKENDNSTENKDNNVNVNSDNKKSFKIRIEIEETKVTTAIKNNSAINTKTEPKFKIIPENNNINNENTLNILKNEENQVLKKKRGRESKKEIVEDVHTKYSDDNVRRKCKHIVLSNLMKFINNKINEVCDNIGRGMLIKKLLIINQKQTANATILFNQFFLQKKIGDIFMADISTKYTNYKPDHNRYVISSLINDNNENNRNYFNKLFNLTFLDCLQHFRGSIFIPELEGMTSYDEFIEESNFDDDYLEVLNHYIKDYENITYNKKAKMRNN